MTDKSKHEAQKGKEFIMNESEKHDRREFIKKSLSMGVAAGSTLMFGKPGSLFAKEAASVAPDLVAVKNGEPDAMFSKAIGLMGGMNKYVKKGQSVVVKPNIGWNKPPEVGANTNPLLVKAVVEHCFQAGAKKVYVFDNVAYSSTGMADQCYKNSGIEDAAKSAGALVTPAHHQKYYHKVDVPGGKSLKTTAVHELVLESDVLINIPVLKNHRGTHLTIAMKNLMGIVWDRLEYHHTGLDQCIADFCLYKKPALNIVDAYRVMMKDGPQGSVPENAVLKKTLLMSEDLVAIDTAATKIFGMKPEQVGYIRMANELGIGNMNLNELKIKRHVMS